MKKCINIFIICLCLAAIYSIQIKAVSYGISGAVKNAAKKLNEKTAASTPIPSFLWILTPTLRMDEYGTNYIKLKWFAYYSDEGYAIERKVGTGSYAEITRTAQNIEVFIDTDISTGNSYYYRMRAFVGESYSDYSQVLVFKTLPPSAPINLLVGSTEDLDTDLKYTLLFSLQNDTDLIEDIKVYVDEGTGTFPYKSSIYASPYSLKYTITRSKTAPIWKTKITTENIFGESGFSNTVTLE